MPTPILLPRRSVKKWALHGGLAIVAAAAGYLSITHSLATVIKTRDPVLAHALAPDNGRITAQLAEQRFMEKPTGGRRSPAARLAEQALRQDPTAVEAVATLGLQAQLRNETGAARRLFAYSQTLSRRDLKTQLWAVEDAVARGDISGALQHYDIALRTSKNAPDILFPVLGSAISEPAIRKALVATLAQKPAWTQKFITYIADGTVDSRARASLFTALRRIDLPLSAEADAAAIKGLIDLAAIDEAWRYYASVRPGSDRRKSRDPGFTANLSTPSPFDWTTSIDPNVTAAFQRNRTASVFDFSVPSGVSGMLVQQLQWLTPGIYRLEGRSSGIEQTGQALLYWTLACSDGRELGRVEVPPSAQAGGTFSGRFVVPATCPLQLLALTARPPENPAGVTGQIEQIRLIPVN